MKTVRKIAFYGKGGIGKSTTVSNIACALSVLGYKVMQIGCDPKADSTINHLEGKKPVTILEAVSQNEDIELDDIATKAKNGVICIEAGGPKPGIGCAGRGIITAFEELEELDAYEKFDPDFILYDVLGDVVCGGFATPIKNGFAQEVYIVTSGEMMSLYAASNIANAIKNAGRYGYAMLKGYILNCKNIQNEEEIAKQASGEEGVEVVFKIPRDKSVQDAESEHKTVVEAMPKSDMANVYMSLAKKIASNV